MAQNANISVPANTWTQITNADATALTFFNNGECDVWLQGTVGAVSPTGGPDGIRYTPGQGSVNVTLANLFLGVTGVTRIYAFSKSNATVFVSQA